MNLNHMGKIRKSSASGYTKIHFTQIKAYDLNIKSRKETIQTPYKSINSTTQKMYFL